MIYIVKILPPLFTLIVELCSMYIALCNVCLLRFLKPILASIITIDSNDVNIIKFAYRFAALLENTFSLSFAVQIAIVTTGMSITLMQVSHLRICVIKLQYNFYNTYLFTYLRSRCNCMI